MTTRPPIDTLFPETLLLIDGELVEAEGGRTMGVNDPAHADVVLEVACGGAGEIARAAEAADRAFRGTSWAADAVSRARALHRLSELIAEHAERLAALEAIDGGKPLRETRHVDVPIAAEVFRFYAGMADKIHGSVLPAQGRFLAYTLREPYGVVGQIIPWNFPLIMVAWKLAPALAAGNTVVLKPAEDTPLSALFVARLCVEAGFPPGVVNIVPGFGEEAGAALVAQPELARIAFTGSTEVGRIVMAEAAAVPRPVSLELGGKSPNLVFGDADLKNAVRSAFNGIFYNKGEVCTAGSRLLVERAALSHVLDLVAERARALRLGDPFDPATRMGPQVSQAQRERVLDFVRVAVEEGATLVAGGEACDPVGDGGYFVRPTVFSDVDPDSSLAREEVFGPVLAVIPFDEEEEAIALAGRSPYGLAAGVHTRDLGRAHRVAAALPAGIVWVNTYNVFDRAVPFGGTRASGFGRELGVEGMLAYTRTKSVVCDLS